jgi:site-specific recombinase XerD
MARPCVTAICKASIASISFCGFSPSITAKAALTALASTLLLLSRKTVSSRASSISTNAGELVPSASVNRVCQPRSSECVGVTDSSVCLQPNYEPWPPRNLSSAFIKFIKASGLRRVRLHDLRHSHATHLLMANLHPKIVQQRLGQPILRPQWTFTPT